MTLEEYNKKSIGLSDNDLQALQSEYIELNNPVKLGDIIKGKKKLLLKVTEIRYNPSNLSWGCLYRGNKLINGKWVYALGESIWQNELQIINDIPVKDYIKKIS